jgi:hypothetical protein
VAASAIIQDYEGACRPSLLLLLYALVGTGLVELSIVGVLEFLILRSETWRMLPLLSFELMYCLYRVLLSLVGAR